MKITFRDGYKVEINDKDIRGLSKHQIINEAMAVKDAVKKQVNDVPFAYSYDPKNMTQITKIKNAIDRRTGEVLNERALNKQIELLNIDLDADLAKHADWGRTRSQEALYEVIKEYDKVFAELERVRDPEFVDKKRKALDKYKEIKINWGLEEPEVEDAEIHDTPLGEMSRTVNFKNAPGLDFSVTNLNRGVERASSRGADERALGVRLIKNEFEDLRDNLKYDIEHAAESVGEQSKEDLRLAMDMYASFINAFNLPELEAEFHELNELYNQLYYNGYHLGRREVLSTSRNRPLRRGR